MLLNTSSYSAHSLLDFVSIFLRLFCSTSRVALLAVYLYPFQSLPLWFAQHLELICSLLTCLDSRDSLFQPFVLCVENSTRSASCSVLSGGYLNTLTFVGLVLVSSCFIHRMSIRTLSIRTFSHLFEFGFCLAAFCTFVIASLKRLPSTQPSHAVAKRPLMHINK